MEQAFPATTVSSIPTTVLITGASSGIGRATARLFAERGFRVFGTSRSRLPDEHGVEMLELDVSSDVSVRRCVADVLARAGAIDVLVNNAGIWQVGIAEETTMEEARRIFEINFFGVVRVTDAVLPLMRRRERGRIINIGSLGAWVGEPGEAFYSASKYALAGYTEALRHEVWPLGIHVSIVEPGAFKTSIGDRLPKNDGVLENSGAIEDYAPVRQAVRNTLLRTVQHGDDPRKVARIILDVACAPLPRLRYGVGRGAHLLPYSKVLLPQRLFEYLLRRGFGLKKRQ